VSEILEAVIDALQDINQTVAGINQSPHLLETPNTLSTAHLPLIMTEVVEASYIPLHAGQIDLEMKSTVFIDAVEQNRYQNILEQTTRLADNLRNKYEDNTAYTNTDGTRTFLNDSTLVQVASIKQNEAMIFSGRKLIEYPERSGNWYHGFDMTFGVLAFDG
jgi:hypothetical protein